jgi:hypothetical protein
MTIADDLVANIQAANEIFIAGVKAADENSPSARKLAALIASVENAMTYPRPEMLRRLYAALDEARR